VSLEDHERGGPFESGPHACTRQYGMGWIVYHMATHGPAMNPEPIESITITLDRSEAQFLITVLKSSNAILTALLALQKSIPELPPPPIDENAIATISALARNIEKQINPTG
jgi:hypothetical protein